MLHQLIGLHVVGSTSFVCKADSDCKMASSKCSDSKCVCKEGLVRDGDNCVDGSNIINFRNCFCKLALMWS